MGKFLLGVLVGVYLMVAWLFFAISNVHADDSSVNSASGNEYARDGD